MPEDMFIRYGAGRWRLRGWPMRRDGANDVLILRRGANSPWWSMWLHPQDAAKLEENTPLGDALSEPMLGPRDVSTRLAELDQSRKPSAAQEAECILEALEHLALIEIAPAGRE